MERPAIGRNSNPGRSAARGLAWLVGAIAGAAAIAVGAMLTLVFAVTAVVIVIMAVALLALAGAAMRARRTAQPEPDPNLIEARNVGGHSWVAYGWDGRR